ncbi:MAG TPA: aminotransferase class V-fold PLP-dependent enzyme [Chloroflexota bacterium]|nr:aminotransferase class V-fold PLP-dependent enzyme [Chloroflexota bacterium]
MRHEQPADLLYLDNAATTYPKPEAVYQAADAFYRTGGGNAERGRYPLARAAADVIARTRAKLAAWLGAGAGDQIILAPSATIALNQVILGTPLPPGAVAYVTPFEHNSALRPLEHRRQTAGIHVRELPFDRTTWAFDAPRARAMLQAAPPALLVVSQASNVCGYLLPVVEIVQAARAANPACVVVVDGAQAAGLYPLDLAAGAIDYYVFSGHKSLYGPYGIAGFVLASGRRPAPILFGATGTQSDSVAMPLDVPSAYEPGSQNAWAAAGLDAALDWLAARGRAAVVAPAEAAAHALRDRLRALPGVTVYAPPADRWMGIVAFTAAGQAPAALADALAARGIAVRAGLHCAPWIHRWLGTLAGGGVVRASPSYFTPPSAADTLERALREALPTRR